jgi:Cu2+-exporting ATPase
VGASNNTAPVVEVPAPLTKGCCGSSNDDDNGEGEGEDEDKNEPPGDTCRDNCCADTEKLKTETVAAASEDSCKDACCSENKPPVDACCSEKETACCSEKEPAVDTCCSEKKPAVDACCSEKKTAVDACCGEEKPAVDACCSEKKTAVEDPNNPSCCEGKPSPCCDVSCLDRLAARECKEEAGTTPLTTTTTTSSSRNVCDQYEDGKPCKKHTRSIREKYAAKLEALGCLCRVLLAIGQESCCPPQPRSSLERKSCSRRSTSVSRRSVDSSFGRRAGGKGKGCCVKNTKATAQKDVCTKGCCADTRSVGRASVESCCNTGKMADKVFPAVKVVPQDTAIDVDLESGLSGKEHVVLSISGMTCTGCETQLKRTLASLNPVKNLKTSLVLSRAEFDLDLSSGSVAEVMRHLERTTGFKCETVTNRGSNIDIVTPGDALDFVKGNWPLGVSAMTVVDKNTVNATFDAKAIGPRDLLERGWDTPMALAPPRGDPTINAGSRHVRNIGLLTILSAALTIPVLVMVWAPLPERAIAYDCASFALATLVQFLIAGPFYPKALKALLFSGMIEMDLLIVLSTTAAYVFSVVSFGYLVAGRPLSTGEFFETSTLLVTLIMVGRYVAALARQKAIESISIRSLQAPTAILVEEGGEREIDVRLLQHGDIFRVLPDSKIPTDGTVISGSSEVDESMVTGESIPVEKYVKSAVIAGSINSNGTLVVRLDRLPGDNTISGIADMVDKAKLSKPKLQDIADRVASYFVPVVVAITVIVFCVWIAVGIAIQGKSASEAAMRAVTFAITVLIVSCPCAIGLAVPMVIVIGSGIAAGRGVIIRDAAVIEVAYKTSHVVLDKTGTLTEGRLTIARELYLDSGRDTEKSKSMLLALLSSNKHPVSAAVAAHLRANGVTPAADVSDPKSLTGKGVEASTSSGLKLRAGNSRWLELSANADVQSVLNAGYTTFCFTVDRSPVAVFGLQDSLRPDAHSTVAQLQRQGVAVHIISGDDDAAVRAVASHLGIPDSHVRSRCTPVDKQAYIQELMSAGGPGPGNNKKKKKAGGPTVIFCGDGTNDAVALAQATVGVHVNHSGGGTDVARSAADVVLMRPSLAGIPTLMRVSSKCVGRIAFNFGWSAVYNLFAVLLGAGAFSSLGGVRIPPEFAGLGELASVLPVVLAAVLLRWERI